MRLRQNQSGFSPVELILIVVVVSLLGLSGLLVYDRQKKDNSTSNKSKEITSFEECVAAGNPVMESYPEQCAASGKTFTKKVEEKQSGWHTTVDSGKGFFSVSLPDGWDNIMKVLDSDWLMIKGEQQPTVQPGKPAVVKELPSYGGDGASVFTIIVHDNFADPEGTQTDFTLTNNKENPVKGKKYTKIYESDEVVGIGIQRFKGDRDYQYVFDVGGNKQLRVWYSVYGSDPRNNVEVVEAVINSIRLKK